MKQVIWVSHRGYCNDAVENTRRSFDTAIALGFEHLETDLRATADGVIILQHNGTLDHTCAQSLAVETSPWSKLKTQKTIDGQSILTLTELFELYPQYHWTLDIKGPFDERTLDLLLIWARGHKAERWLEKKTRFLLWSRSAEIYAKKLFPRVLTLAQEKECLKAGLAVLFRIPQFGGLQKGRTYSIPPFFSKVPLFTKRTLDAYHAKGARLLAYLPDRDEDARKAYFLGFDEILTNGRKLF